MVMNSPKKRQLEETIVSKVRRTLKDGRAKRAELPLPEAEPIASAMPSADELFRVSIRRGLHSKGARSSEDARSLPPYKEAEVKNYGEAQSMCVPVVGSIAMLLGLGWWVFSYFP